MGAAIVVEILGDRALTPDEFIAFLKTMGFRTQGEAAEALGVNQGYISKLRTGKKAVLPGTSLMHLLRALLQVRALERRVAELERNAPVKVVADTDRT
jgi:predicted transcriptional regulator